MRSWNSIAVNESKQLEDRQQGANELLYLTPLTLNVNRPLHWGEWFGVVLPTSAAIALACTGLFSAFSAIWFLDLQHILAPFIAIFGTLVVASIIQKGTDRNQASPWWRVPMAIVGVTLISLTLIRLLVFPKVASDDWGWLASLSHLLDTQGEQPHAELGLLILTLFLWQTGRRLGTTAGDYDERRRSFFSYFGVLVGAIVISAGVDTQTHVDATIAVIIPIFLICSLLGLSQTRLADVRARLQNSTGTVSRTRLVWQLTSAGMNGITALLVLASGAIFYSRSYATALTNAGNIWGRLIDIVTAGILIIATPIINAIITFFGTIRNQNATVAPLCPTATLPPEAIFGTQPTPSPLATAAPNCVPPRGLPQSPIIRVAPLTQGTVQLIFGVVVVLILVVLAIYLFTRIRRILATTTGIGFAEVHEDMRHDLPPPATPAVTPQTVESDLPLPGTVRATYRQFLQQSRAIGFPRQASETPREYRQRIARNTAVQPEYQDIIEDIAALTNAYNAERYGATPLPPTRMEQLSAIAHQITQRLHRRGKG